MAERYEWKKIRHNWEDVPEGDCGTDCDDCCIVCTYCGLRGNETLDSRCSQNPYDVKEGEDDNA